MALTKNQSQAVAANNDKPTVDWEGFLAGFAGGKTDIEYGANRNIFCQGQPADSVFYLRRGKVKIAVTSDQGKEAIVAILAPVTSSARDASLVSRCASPRLPR